MNFIEAKRQIKEQKEGYPEVKLALLADLPSQHLAIAVKGVAAKLKLNFEVFEGPFGQIDQMILVHESALYQSDPEFVVICKCVKELQRNFYASDKKKNFSDEVASQYENIAGQLLSRHPDITLIISNFPEIDDAVFGNFAGSIESSFKRQLSLINQRLMDISEKFRNIRVLDLSSLSAYRGQINCFDVRQFYRSGLLFDLDFLPEIALNIIKIIQSDRGHSNKCLVLDLDNTIWGGVIGDDGVDGIKLGGLYDGKIFSDIQFWFKQLKDRGVLLAVCSKNELENAIEPFKNHPEMILREEDISVFIANWENKAQNIEQIRQKLNIGLDSIVFVDDNPVERALVKEFLPEVTVPELPDDPAEYLDFLQRANLFEVSSFTEQDANRTSHFISEKKRDELQVEFMDESEFLKQLEMVCSVQRVCEANLDRCYQLLTRTNQFNVTGKRYSVEELREVATDESSIGMVFSLADKFGNYGITSLMIGRSIASTVTIDAWVMSCRVFNKSLEEVCINSFVQLTKERFGEHVSIDTLFLPTKKNQMITSVFNKLGFKCVGKNKWRLNLSRYSPKQHAITEITLDY